MVVRIRLRERDRSACALGGGDDDLWGDQRPPGIRLGNWRSPIRVASRRCRRSRTRALFRAPRVWLPAHRRDGSGWTSRHRGSRDPLSRGGLAAMATAARSGTVIGPTESGPLLSVVTPVYNGAAFIAENVSIIRRELSSAGVSYELIVVSDGSADDTVQRVAGAAHPEVRILHYDRNIGKGYAVKLGLLAARGRFVGFIDSDLDLHPAELASFLAARERDSLDAALGSTRQPESQVDS